MPLNGNFPRRPQPLYIDRDDLLARIKLSINDFSTVFTDMEMELLPHEFERLRPEGSITGIISFQGTYKGHVWASCSETFASFMASRLKNAEDGLLESHAREVVGEVAHILGGELKLFLSPGGRVVELSAPSVFKGNELDCSGFDTGPRNLCCTFRYGQERLQVGVVLCK